MNFRRSLTHRLSRAGYELRRTDAKRRAALLHAHDVDLILDIGAAVGNYGKELRHFGYEGRIISMEPIRAQYDQLVTKAADDPLWDTLNVAIGDQAGELEINVAANGDSSSFLPMLDRLAEEAPYTRYTGRETVKVETLDDACLAAVQKSSRAFAKIDTQGSEEPVLNGGQEVLKLLHGIQIEVTFTPLYDGAVPYEQIVRVLSDAGFHLEAIEPGFRSKSQQLLQADFIFFRSDPTASAAHPS